MNDKEHKSITELNCGGGMICGQGLRVVVARDVTDEECEELSRMLDERGEMQAFFPIKHTVEQLRPCKGVRWSKGEWRDITGRFHGWGSDYEEFCDAGPGNFTVGIIEQDDGTVAMCRADTIEFLDRGINHEERR